MKTTVQYKGWSFVVYPARRERAGDLLHPDASPEEISEWDADYPNGLIEECDYSAREGFNIDLMVAYRNTNEIVRLPTAYPEDEELFDTVEEAITYVRDGLAYIDAMRSLLGDNIDIFKRTACPLP